MENPEKSDRYTLRKEVPSGQIPSEGDSVGGLRQDDLAVIRSKEQ